VDMLDKMSITGKDEQVNEKEHHNKGVENEGKAKDQTSISKVKVSQICSIYFVIH